MWFIGEALVAIARNLAAAKQFDRVDLIAWCPAIAKRPRAASLALERLHVLQFIQPIATPAPVRRTKKHRGVRHYTITPEGVDAAKAAQAEAARQHRSVAALAMSESTRAKSEFAKRLWALLRMRQSLTPLDAAELLVNAGEDLAIAKARASTYLRTWSKSFPTALQISAQRVGRFQRYVLVEDLGPSVPCVAIGSVYPKYPKGGAAA